MPQGSRFGATYFFESYVKFHCKDLEQQASLMPQLLTKEYEKLKFMNLNKTEFLALGQQF